MGKGMILGDNGSEFVTINMSTGLVNWLESSIPIEIDYKIGDEIVSAENPERVLGICTGFRHNNECIDINGKCYGGKYYFMKSEWVQCEIID